MYSIYVWNIVMLLHLSQELNVVTVMKLTAFKDWPHYLCQHAVFFGLLLNYQG
jgi:N-acetylmuramoyl-L-alanine amidase CwlA